MLGAMVVTLSEGAGTVADAAAADVINTIDSVFSSKGAEPKHLGSRSFSVDLGTILGRALAAAPFKLLDEFFNDLFDDKSYRRR